MTTVSKLLAQAVHVDDGIYFSLRLMNQNCARNNHLKLRKNHKIFVKLTI